MPKITCKQCQTVSEVAVVDDTVTCPQCNAVYRVGRASAPAEAAPAVAADAPFPAVGTATNAHTQLRGRTRNAPPVPVVPAGPVGLILAAVGGVLLLPAVIIFMASPLRTRISNASELKAASEQNEDELLAVQTQISATTERQHKAVILLASEKIRTTELQDKLERIEYQLKFIPAMNQRDFTEQTQQLAEQTKIAEKVQTEVSNISDRNDPAKIIARCEKCVLVISNDMGSGSGFVFMPDGLAVTNYHVIEGSSALKVRIQKRNSRELVELNAKVVAIDADRDMALLQLPPAPAEVGEAGKYIPARCRDDQLPKAGENVIAIGNPGLGACCTNHFQSCKSFKIGLAVTDPKGVMRMQMVCATGS